MKKVGILGGTFDPIHLGHLQIAIDVFNKVGLNLIYFIPTGKPPLKEKPPIANAVDRYKMAQLAIRRYKQFDILDWEILKKTPSFSVETAEILQKNWPSMQFYWIIGSDLVKYLSSWKNISKLAEIVQFIVVTRPGYKMEIPNIPNLKIQTIENRAVDISSTEIRDKARHGESIESLVPEAVNNYIVVNQLYNE